MRVLFVVPRSFNPKQMYREYPLGVGFLGTLLKQAGHDVRIFDQNVEAANDESWWRLIAQFQPGVVGFSVMTPNYPVARSQIQELKRRYEHISIIAGGVHATLFPEDLLNDGADIVVLGEGEPVIADLVACLEHNREPHHVPHIVFRSASGGTVRSSAHPQLTALDELPMVDRSLYNLPRYTHHSMLASRGCPYHCDFCCNYTGTVRSDGVAVRRPEGVIEEIEHLRDSFGAREIFFADDIFLVRKQDILAFCRAYTSRRVGVRWIAQLRVDRLDAEVAEAMAASGCQRVYLGIESGSDRILQNVHKGITTEQIRRGVSAALAAGLRVKTGWIYGLPGPIAEQYKSIPFMLELRPHEISIHQLIPFPGTVYYSNPDQFGIRIANPKSFESFCYGGLDGNIQFDYLSQSQYVELLKETGRALEAAGYVSSDRARSKDQFIYTTPLCRNSMNVFRPAETAVSV